MSKVLVLELMSPERKKELRGRVPPEIKIG